MVTISQYIRVSNHHFVHLSIAQCYMSIIFNKNEGGWNKERGKFEKHGFPKVSGRLTTQGGYSGVKCGTAGSANGQKDGA